MSISKQWAENHEDLCSLCLSEKPTDGYQYKYVYIDINATRTAYMRHITYMANAGTVDPPYSVKFPNKESFQKAMDRIVAEGFYKFTNHSMGGMNRELSVSLLALTDDGIKKFLNHGSKHNYLYLRLITKKRPDDKLKRADKIIREFL